MVAPISLSEIQRLLSQAIQDPTKSFGDSNTDSHSDSNSIIFSRIIRSRPPLSSEKRLDIYKVAYRERMNSSLAEDFPDVPDRVGRPVFNEFVGQYFKLYPSHYDNLAEASQNFPFFLKNISQELYELAGRQWIQI